MPLYSKISALNCKRNWISISTWGMYSTIAPASVVMQITVANPGPIRNYQLTAGGVCYRTEIAAAITYMTPKDWQDHVLGYSSQSVDERRSAKVVRNWIGAYIEEADTAIRYLDSVLSGKSDQFHSEKVQMLLNRWRQIRRLCFQALDTVPC